MKYVLAITLLLSLATIPATAQSSALKADVPFSFTVGKTVFAPGVYTLSRRDEQSRDVLIIRGQDGRAAFLAGTPLHTLELGREGKLVFNHSDAGYTLAQVWISGDDNGEQFAAPALSMEKMVITAGKGTGGANGQ